MDIAYDESSNITAVADNIHTAAAGTHLWDVAYAVDGLDRVTSADEGELTGTSITTQSRIESWTLGQPGVHKTRWLDLTGGGSPNYSDAGEFKEDRTFNEANELTQRGVGTNNSPG